MSPFIPKLLLPAPVFLPRVPTQPNRAIFSNTPQKVDPQISYLRRYSRSQTNSAKVAR